jgi:hypothetical protein
MIFALIFDIAKTEKKNSTPSGLDTAESLNFLPAFYLFPFFVYLYICKYSLGIKLHSRGKIYCYSVNFLKNLNTYSNLFF